MRLRNNWLETLGPRNRGDERITKGISHTIGIGVNYWCCSVFVVSNDFIGGICSMESEGGQNDQEMLGIEDRCNLE